MANLSTAKARPPARWLSGAMAALLTLPPAAASAGPAAAVATVTPALSIDSDPPGASVYVDGRFTGETPLTVARIAAGEHRVRLVKPGYIENARIMNVAPKQVSAVRVRLTPDAGAAARTGAARIDATQVTTADDESRAKKWIIIGAAAGGGAAALYLIANNRNKAPSTPTIAVNTNQGLASGTAFTFTASASDPDNDPLTYNWDFGDGSTAPQSPTQHVYVNPGSFNVTVRADDGKGHTVTSGGTPITVRSMAGAWSGTFAAFNFTLNLTQNGATIGGSYADSDGPGTVTGVVSSGNAIRITITQGPFQPFTFTGATDNAVSTASGSVSGLNSAATFSMRR